MHKHISLWLCLLMLFSLVPQISAETAEAAANTPKYVMENFENGWDPTGKDVPSVVNVSWSNENTCDNSLGVIDFSCAQNHTSVAFPIETPAGTEYELSVWVRPNETPATQQASFIFYNPAQDGTYAKCWNQISVQPATPFKAGEWTYCTATYTANGKATRPGGTKTDITSIGTVEFRLGSGNVATDFPIGKKADFALDNFSVIPQNFKKVQAGELMPGGRTFNTQSDFSDYWKNYGGRVKTTHLSDDGVGETKGALNIQVLSTWGTIAYKTPLPIAFFTKYRFSFWAKATDDTAVGERMFFYLGYDQTQAANGLVPKWSHIYADNEDDTLTAEWKQFVFTFTVEQITTLGLYPETFALRVGDGKKTLSYAVDEFSLVQAEPFSYKIVTNYYDTFSAKSHVVVSNTFSESTRKSVVYRMYEEVDNVKHTIVSGVTDESDMTLDMPENVADRNIYLETFGVDAFGNVSCPNVIKIEHDEYFPQVRIEPDRYLWNKDYTDVGAYISYDEVPAQTTASAVCAQYDNEGKLVGVAAQDVTVRANTKGEATVYASGKENAAVAKFYLWDKISSAPLCQPCFVEKIEDGTFVYVDPTAAKGGDGSKEKPYNAFNTARNKLKTLTGKANTGDLYLVLAPGEYRRSEPLNFSEEGKDWATDKTVTYMSLSRERASFTGGSKVTGFSLFDADKGIWRASVPKGTKSRELYVNDIKATRARTVEDPAGFNNLDYYGKYSQQEFVNGAPNANYHVFENRGLENSDGFYATLKKPTEVEIWFTDNWRHRFVCPDTITATETGGSLFTFSDPGNRYAWSVGVTDNTPMSLPVYLENAYEFVDEAGEWYLDSDEGYVYYIPRAFEDLESANIVLPTAQQLICVNGTPDAPAENLRFLNLEFCDTTWNYPTDKRSFLNGQNATYTNAYGGQLMDGAVDVYCAKNFTFDNCLFTRIGSMGLKLWGAIQNTNVIGNEFYDIAGSALNIGDVAANIKAEHRAGLADQSRYPVDSKFYVTNNVISENYMHKLATVYRSAAGLGAGFPKNTVISHNELEDGPYSGIHTGWGWGSTAPSGTENFVVEKNYIHNFMNWRLFDGGGIYMLGNTGGTKDNYNQLRQNYFQDIQNAYGAIYPDEGSTYWEIAQNVIDESNYPVAYKREEAPSVSFWLHVWTGSIQNILMHNNFSTTVGYRDDGGANTDYVAPTICKTDSWPQEARQIISEAGVSPAYRYRFRFDLQLLRMSRCVTMQQGQNKIFYFQPVGSKDQKIDFSDYQYTVKSSAPQIVSVQDRTLTAHTAGKAWITVTYYKEKNGEISNYGEHTFYVSVS